MTSKHDYCGIVCKHSNLKFCAHCNVPYCKDCGKEWRDISYSWYSTPSIYSANVGSLQQPSTTSLDPALATTCNHEE